MTTAVRGNLPVGEPVAAEELQRLGGDLEGVFRGGDLRQHDRLERGHRQRLA